METKQTIQNQAEEQRQLLELLKELPKEKLKEIYLISKGAAFVAEHEKIV